MTLVCRELRYIPLQTEKVQAYIKETGGYKNDRVTGGAGGWQKYARGSYVNFGSYVVYTVASGDVLTGIAPRFGVTVAQIQQWNDIKNPNVITAGQKLTIYPTVIR